MKNASDKSCVKTRIAHFMFNDFFENRAVYEIMWKSSVQRGRPQMTIWRMHIACWIPKAANTYTGNVTIIAFPLQQWWHKCTSCYIIPTLPVLLIHNLFYRRPVALNFRRLSCATALERVPWHIAHNNDLDIHLVLVYSGPNSMFFLSQNMFALKSYTTYLRSRSYWFISTTLFIDTYNPPSLIAIRRWLSFSKISVTI